MIEQARSTSGKLMRVAAIVAVIVVVLVSVLVMMSLTNPEGDPCDPEIYCD